MSPNVVVLLLRVFPQKNGTIGETGTFCAHPEKVTDGRQSKASRKDVTLWAVAAVTGEWVNRIEEKQSFIIPRLILRQLCGKLRYNWAEELKL